MVLLPDPITRDNFPEVWQSVDTRRRTAKKKYITSRFAPFFSNMVFALAIILVGNGLIHDHLEGSYCSFLEDIPFFLKVWDWVARLLIKPHWSLALQIAVPLLVMYLVCFLVCAFFVLLVTAVYHPFKRKLPEGTDKENAEQLLSMAKDARRYSLRTGASGSMLWAFVFTMIQFCVLSLYVMIELETLDKLFVIAIAPFMKLLEPLTRDFTDFQLMNIESALFLPSLFVYSLSLYLGYAFMNYFHALTIRPLYRYHTPYSYVAEVEYYFVFAGEDNEGKTEEEIQAQRTQTAQAKLKEALEMEKLGAYGRAKELLSQAAHAGDAEAMEHYARHWLIGQAKDPGRYWLERCVATGNASEQAQKNLKRMKWRRKIKAAYLK